MRLSILIVDDEPVFRSLAQETLNEYGYDTHAVGTLAEARSFVDETACDLLVLDRRLPDGDGVEFLRHMRKQDGDETPVIVVTAFGDVQNAVTALHLGAADYMVKPVQVAELLVKIQRIEQVRNLQERLSLAEAPAVNETLCVLPMSESRKMRCAQLKTLRDSPRTPVLITGPSGVGKRFFAERLHINTYGEVATAPFVAVHCASLQDDTGRDELFGRARKRSADGHVTPGVRGLLERADGGTLFLDEVAEMPLRLQARLVDVLEQMRVRPKGAARTLQLQLRVVATSHHDLPSRVARGLFRADLYHRLAVFLLPVPPLRENPVDIMPIALVFLKHFNARLSKAIDGISPAAQRLLLAYSYPGNLRELRNIIERAVILAQDTVLHAGDIVLPRDGVDLPGFEPPFFGMDTDGRGRPHPLEHAERLYVKRVLMHFGGRRTAASDALGISYPTFLKRLRELGIADGSRHATGGVDPQMPS